MRLATCSFERNWMAAWNRLTAISVGLAFGSVAVSAAAQTPVLVNPSFEATVVADGGRADFLPRTDFEQAGWVVDAELIVDPTVFNPQNAQYPSTTGVSAPLPGSASGAQTASFDVGPLFSSSSRAQLSQNVNDIGGNAVMLQPSTWYTVTAAAGRRLTGDVLNLALGFDWLDGAVGRRLSERVFTGSGWTPGTFQDVSHSFITGPNMDPVAYRVTLGGRPDLAAGAQAADVDNVRLTVEELATYAGPSSGIVSNLAEPSGVNFSASGTFAHASSFVTGDVAHTLASLSLAMSANTPGASEVRVRADDGGQPGSVLEILGLQPIAAGQSTVTFTSAGLSLAPNTTYWVTAGERGSGDVSWSGTTSTDETSPSGWTIGDQSYTSANGGDNWTATDFGPANESGLFSVAVRTEDFLEADFNLDHEVDGEDLDLWEAGYGAAGDALRGDGDADGDEDSDGEDFLAWQRQVGTMPAVAAAAGPSATPVPEPCAAWLLGTAVAVIGWRGRRELIVAKPIRSSHGR